MTKTGKLDATERAAKRAVLKMYPAASVDDFTDREAETPVPSFAIGEDWEESDGMIGRGATEGEAWIAAAANLSTYKP